jgi:hypothetical protein
MLAFLALSRVTPLLIIYLGNGLLDARDSVKCKRLAGKRINAWHVFLTSSEISSTFFTK